MRKGCQKLVGRTESLNVNSEIRDIFLLFPPDLFLMPKRRLSHRWVHDKYLLRDLMNKWVNRIITMNIVQLGYPVI